VIHEAEYWVERREQRMPLTCIDKKCGALKAADEGLDGLAAAGQSSFDPHND